MKLKKILNKFIATAAIGIAGFTVAGMNAGTADAITGHLQF